MGATTDELDARAAEWIAEARTLGIDAAKAAASWVIDGNRTTDESANTVLTMLNDGDPAVDAYLPARPDLSGTWADSPTPRSLFEQVTGLDAHAESTWNADAYDAVSVSLCEAWEDGVAETFTAECERLLLEYLGRPPHEGQ